MAPTYKMFLQGVGEVVQATHKALYPGAYSCWVVGLHRQANGELLPLNHDIARLHRESGFMFCEEIILHHQNNGAIQRVGNFEKGRHHLVRVHEYALVFRRQ